MTDPLLVPVALDAMVHNSPATNFVRGAMNYAQLDNFQPPEPAPFTNDLGDAFSQDARNHGVYLMWTLPQALRHGAAQPDGSYKFPLVPDRWLVVRHYWPDAGGGTANAVPQAAAWVVQSDFLDPQDGATPYLDPNQAQRTLTRIGRKVAVSETQPWSEPGAPSPSFLTAVAESCPAFAAYQPFNQDVFSIFDDLSNQSLGAGTLSYFALGWYADPAADILAEAAGDADAFATLMTSLGWTASGLPGAAAATSLYHGAVNGVRWDPAGPAPASPSDSAAPQIALGNSGIDGVTAFARAAFAGVASPPADLTADAAAELIEAFQYDVLDKLALPGAESIVEQEIRSRWFGSSDGGTLWAIVGAPAAPGSAATPPPPLTADETQWLADLNAAQLQYDEAVRTLTGLRRTLYETWWKYAAATKIAVQSGRQRWPWMTSDAQFRQALNALAGEVQQQLASIAPLLPLIPRADADTTLEQAARTFAGIKNLRPELALKPVAQPRYWMPADPVAVISNTAHLLKIEPDAKLGCRWPAEVANAIVAGGANFSASAMAPSLPTIPWTGLPAQGAALYAEAFLLDPAAAAAASAAAGAAVGADAIAAATAAAGGLLPALAPAWPWAQAWRPLFLDWMVEWSAIPFEQPDGAANWTFNGLDYDLASGFTFAAIADEIEGRAILTPKPSFEFKSRLDQFLRDHADSPAAAQLAEIEGLVETVDQWDFLSQALGGFNTALAKRKPAGSAAPDPGALAGGASVADLVGGEIGPPPDPQQSRATGGGRSPPLPSSFEGLRAGQFYVNRISVVDAFGQTIEAVRAPNDQDVPRSAFNIVFHPLLADGVAPTRTVATLEPARFVQLPPRLLQPARLNFRFDPGATGTAISGWLIPNHLDGSLIVYGADGAVLGSLARGTDADRNAELVWSGGPGSHYPDGPDGFQQMVADHDRLGAMLAGLFAAGPDAFSAMLQTIDETLWTVDPLGARSDAFLSVLVGRPLAVVAASLSLELQAPAVRDPDWPYTFQSPPPAPAFLNYSFPVRLGDLGYRQDGLIGYFAAQKYDRFNALHLPEGIAPGYLQAVAPGNYVELGFADGGPGPAADLTMLIDPRGQVHAQCALVPVKQIALPPVWVDGALAAMSVAFTAGPALAETRLVPQADGSDAAALVLNAPAERQGSWAWLERDASGAWAETPLAAADANPVFPDTRPTLRDGMFRLSGGIKSG